MASEQDQAIALLRARAEAYPHHRGHPRHLHTVSRWLRILGPGLISGAADDDPSAVTTATQTGATFGFGQLWLALYMLPFMVTVQEMCGRIGIVTGHGVAGIMRMHYSRRLLLLIVPLIFVANAFNVGADFGAMAASAQLLVPAIPFYSLVGGFAAVILGLEVFVPYRHYASVLKVLSLSLLTYVIAGVIAAPNWLRAVAATLLPHLQPTPAFFTLVVAVFGITISPYLFFWQASQQVEEDILHHRHHDPIHGPWLVKAWQLQMSRLKIDTVVGMALAAGTNWFIIFTTGSILHVQTGHIATAAQAASALEPLVHSFPHAGALARALFALGILGTGLLAVPVLAGSAAYGVAETFGWKEGLYRPVWQARGFYGTIALATVIGLSINFFGINPMQALVYAGVFNGLVAVPLLFLILRMANDQKVMGKFTNRWSSNVLGFCVLIMLAAGAVGLVASHYWH